MDNIFKKIIIMKQVMDILLNNIDESDLCRISQKDIALKVGKSSSTVSKTLRKLEKYDKCIEKVAPAVYKVNERDIINYGPISRVIKYYRFIDKDIEIITKTFKEQSILMDMSIEEIQMSQGYLYSGYKKER